MTNPLMSAWTTPYQTPPFDQIETTHFRGAFDVALEQHRAELTQIANNSEAASFDNTVVALERSGLALRRVSMVFSQLTSAATNDALQAVERDVAVLLARHESQMYLDANLFARIDALYQGRVSLGLDPEALKVLERYHLDFVRAGARLGPDERARFAEISERLATLGTQFGQNVLAVGELAQ